MKFTCWLPEQGQHEEDGKKIDGLDGMRDNAGRARNAAVKFAEWHHAQDPESSFPIEVAMRDENRVYYRVCVHRECVPEFVAETVIREERSELAVWTDGTDTVIAHDPDDVYQVLLDHNMISREDFAAGEWDKIPMDQSITVQNFTGHDDAVTMTAAEFIRTQGRTFLCSTEF